MAAQLFSNNAGSMLASSINGAAVSLQVSGGHGALFPLPAGGDFFLVTLVDSAGNKEIVKVTDRSTDVMTIVRAQEGTSALSWTGNATRVELRNTKGTMERFIQLDSGALEDNLDAGGKTISNVVIATPSITDKATVTGINPILQLDESDGAAEQRRWNLRSSAGVLLLETRTDADVAGTNVLRVTRTGAAVTAIQIGNATDNPTVVLLGTGALTTGGAVELGHASDTTIARASAGEITVEGNQVYHAGNTVLTAGTYNPTYTAGTNVSSISGLGTAKYQRVGNIVNVSGACTLDATSGSDSSTDFLISLPIASNLTGITDLAGIFTGIQSATGIIQSNGTSDAAEVLTFDGGNGHKCCWQFSYIVQ